MCGIYITNIPYDIAEVEKKLTKISFRGPDHMGVEKKDDIILGHLRLAILDLDKRSDQPYSFEHLHMVYNGEIYNFKDIKKELEANGYFFETMSDTEVLIKGYHCFGEKLLAKLNGMFAFAIYDTVKNQVFCARDRLGVKPFYYYWNDGKFEICSQLRPIINESLTVSKESISYYLDCGYIPSPYSIFNDVYKLQPGHCLVIDLSTQSKTDKVYWDLEKVSLSSLSYKEAKRELHELLKDAVKIRMKSDVPLGSFLSGGIDSALISAIASKLSDKPINTFTIAFEDPKYDESKIARQYAEIIGSNHIETTCTPEDILGMLKKFQKVYDEPFADSSALPSLLLSKVTKKHVTVALTGDGGDESFMGYLNFLLLKKFRKIKPIPLIFRKWISKVPLNKFLGGRAETIKAILSSRDENELTSKIFTSFDSPRFNKNHRWLDKHYNQFKYLSPNYLQRSADLNLKLWLENDSNVKVDRASMGFSVETRSPFLDYRIVEFARKLPVHYRLREKVTKRIIRDILEEYIPKKVFSQPKKGFAISKGNWIRKELKSEIVTKLNENFLKSVPDLNIEKFKKQFKLHMEERNDYSTSIWKLYILALWCEEFNIKL